MKLTNATVEKMRYEKAGNKADLRFDSELRGFGVRVYPSGVKSFFVAYRNTTNTKRRYTIGDFVECTATDARNQARDLLSQVRKGGDPQADRQEKRKEATLREFAERYLAHVRDRKRSWRHDEQQLRDYVLPALGARKLTEITVQQCQRLHSDMREKHGRAHATANRVAALLRHMLNTAVKWGLIEKSPARHTEMFKEPPPRDVVLSPEDCARLLDACNADPNVHAAALFKLAMFTGRRVGELRQAKWEHYNPNNRVLTLPETKAGERQFVYLNESASAVLRTLPRIAGNHYIIAGEVEGKHLVFYRKAWLRILKRAGLPHFPPHGLRHSYASLLVADGVPLETVGHLLGHKTSVTTKRYAHHRPDNLRKATERFPTIVNLDAERARRVS